MFHPTRNESGTGQLRCDHPSGFAEHHGALYVVGHSCHHGELGKWKVDRMELAEVLAPHSLREEIADELTKTLE